MLFKLKICVTHERDFRAIGKIKLILDDNKSFLSSICSSGRPEHSIGTSIDPHRRYSEASDDTDGLDVFLDFFPFSSIPSYSALMPAMIGWHSRSGIVSVAEVAYG